MNIFSLSLHAEKRKQQRCISTSTIRLLSEVGTEAHNGTGATILFFDHRSKRILERQIGCHEIHKISRQLNAYIVVSHGGTILTVGRRTKRIWRK